MHHLTNFLSYLGIVLFLASCQSSTDRPELQLSDLMIDDGTGSKSYLNVLGVSPESLRTSNSLPLPEIFGLPMTSLPKSADWMAEYNFDGNNYISRDEMTQAWLIQTTNWKTGKFYPPNSLSSPGQTALQGVSLSIAESAKIRSVIDQITSAGKANANEAHTAINDIQSAINMNLLTHKKVFGAGDD